MTDNQPPGGGEEKPGGESLWQILHSTEGASEPATAEEKAEPSSTDTPAVETTPAEQTKPETPVDAESSEGSLISQIINMPETLAEDFSFGPAEEAEETDFDRSVLNYYRDSGIAVKCRNHPEINAVAQCPECQAYFCQDCFVVRKGRLLCKDCAESIFVPSEEEVISAQEAGWETPQTDISPEEHPEFQIHSSMMGLEGRPAHPFKRLMSLMIDMAMTRILLSIVFVMMGYFAGHMHSPVFHIFDQVDGEFTVQRVFEAYVLFRPIVPWLIIFAVADFTYFFVSLSFFNRTLGMSWMGCRIVTEWGDFVSFGTVALRTLVFMVMLGWPAIILAWLFPAYRGPHDYAAGTLVINYDGVKRIDAYETVQIKL
jgi:uncharacterized RDD family membrane protein YckC